jgi:hypothetical protein
VIQPMPDFFTRSHAGGDCGGAKSAVYSLSAEMPKKETLAPVATLASGTSAYRLRASEVAAAATASRIRLASIATASRSAVTRLAGSCGVAGRHLDPLAPARSKAVARPREQCPTRIQHRVAALIHIETDHIECYLPSRCRIMRNRRRHHPVGAEPLREVVYDGALYEVGGRIAPYLQLMD